jgi:serine/threonine-protein kinase RsbW
MHTPAPRMLALRTLSVTYPGTAEQIRVVRADLRVLLGGCPVADDVILCASELATNAAIDSRSRLPGGTSVRVKFRPGHHVLIEVEDKGGPWTPAVPERCGHHGLNIVRAIASGWGIDGDDTARTIWVRFDWLGCE